MNETTTYILMIATFADEAAAVPAVADLINDFKEDRAAMPAAASIVKGADGKLAIRETDDIGAKQGAAAGAVAGGLIGLLSRKRGAVSSAALGALLGGVVAHKLDTGIPDPQLEAIGHSLDDASSAAVAILSDSALAQAKSKLAGLGATVTSEPFQHDTDFVQQMKDGRYSQAMASLAGRAESMVATAGRTTGDTLGKATEAGREFVGKEKSPDAEASAEANDEATA